MLNFCCVEVEYMLEEDDDVLLFILDDDLKIDFKKYFLKLFKGFKVEFSVYFIDFIKDLKFFEKIIFEKVCDFVWVLCVFFYVGFNFDFVEFWVEVLSEII